MLSKENNSVNWLYWNSNHCVVSVALIDSLAKDLFKIWTSDSHVTLIKPKKIWVESFWNFGLKGVILLDGKRHCIGNSVRANTKSNSCLSSKFILTSADGLSVPTSFRTVIHRAKNTWQRLTFIPHASQASQAPPEEGGEREKISPNIYQSSQTL